MIVEVRRYTTQPGKRDAWITYMREVVVPFQESNGMRVLGQYTVDDDEDAFVWMRSFESVEQMREQSEAVYESAYWTEHVAPVVFEHLVRGASTVTILRPTTADALGGVQQ